MKNPWSENKAISELNNLQKIFLIDEQRLSEQMIIIAIGFFALLNIGQILTIEEKLSTISVLISITLGLLFFIVRLVESIESFNTIEEEYFPNFSKIKKKLGVFETFPRIFKLITKKTDLLGGRRFLLFIQFISLIIGFLFFIFNFKNISSNFRKEQSPFLQSDLIMVNNSTKLLLRKDLPCQREIQAEDF